MKRAKEKTSQALIMSDINTDSDDVEKHKSTKKSSAILSLFRRLTLTTQAPAVITNLLLTTCH